MRRFIKRFFLKRKRKKEADKALWFDRDSIYFRPYIKTYIPDERIGFKPTFENVKKLRIIYSH